MKKEENEIYLVFDTDEKNSLSRPPDFSLREDQNEIKSTSCAYLIKANKIKCSYHLQALSHQTDH